MKKETAFTGIAFLSLFLIFFLNIEILSLTWIGILIFIAAVAAAAVHAKIFSNQDLILIMVLYFSISVSYSFYLNPSTGMAKGQGTVLSDSWWQALNWIKENTKECAVIATYWDPGHFITGIAERPVIFDGASQSATLLLNASGTGYKEGITTENYDNGIVQIISVKGDKLYRGRIKDVGISLLTSNETLALKYLKDYKKPGCDEMYYIASSDLIGKSVWWSYFATWDPVNKGKMYSYAILQLSQARPMPAQNAIVYMYPLGQQQSFVVYEFNKTILKPYIQQGGKLLTVEKIFSFTREGMGYLVTDPNADVKGTLWLTPDRQVMVFVPPELENAMFTRLFFLDGQGLEHFKLINNWGGELKLFRINFD